MPFRYIYSPDHTAGLCADRGWDMIVKCNCGHEGRILAADLGLMPPGATLNDIGERLKCQVCGGTEGTSSIIQSVVGRPYGPEPKR